MCNPFPEEPAGNACRRLVSILNSEQCLDFARDNGQRTTSGERNPRLSVSYLFRPGNGQMFGVLVCRDSAGNYVELKAFSGQYNGVWNVPGWVPPLLDTDAHNRQVSQDDPEIQELTRQIRALECLPEDSSRAMLESLRRRRRILSRESLRYIYNLYRFPCLNGHTATFESLLPGFASGRVLPPAGTGDCCAPKLLGAAFSRGLHPVSLAEIFYGSPPVSGNRIPGQLYPPCREKCGLVLPGMLGLNIVYRDEHIVVVDKPAGLLSVPGRGEENKDCIVSRLRILYPDCISQPSVHRLDMDTSGLMVLAFTAFAHRELSRQFMERTVYKEYEALLRGRCSGEAGGDASGLVRKKGRIELPFRLDVENRPRQVYDEQYGKTGITDWYFVSYERCSETVCSDKVLTRIRFIPRTGRTHQLRLHAMHQKGLGAAIQGDRLYGTRLPGERLMLHAALLRFIHPVSGDIMTFESPVPF